MSPRISRAARQRWAAWQSTPSAERMLSPEARAEGYTVVRVPPPSREAFLDLVPLLAAYARVVCRDGGADEVRAAWEAWQLWTRRLGAYLRRVREGKPGTVPALPAVLTALVASDEGLDE